MQQIAESEARLKISLRPEVEEEQVELESASEPDLLTDASLFQKVYNYVVNQSSLIAILTASANAASTNATNNVNAAAADGNIGGSIPGFGSVGGSVGSVGNTGNSGGGTPGMPGGNKGPSGNRIQVIEGTQVSDVYVKPR